MRSVITNQDRAAGLTVGVTCLGALCGQAVVFSRTPQWPGGCRFYLGDLLCLRWDPSVRPPDRKLRSASAPRTCPGSLAVGTGSGCAGAGHRQPVPARRLEEAYSSSGRPCTEGQAVTCALDDIDSVGRQDGAERARSLASHNGRANVTAQGAQTCRLPGPWSEWGGLSGLPPRPTSRSCCDDRSLNAPRSIRITSLERDLSPPSRTWTSCVCETGRCPGGGAKRPWGRRGGGC